MGNCLTKSRPKNGGGGGVTVVPDNSKRKSTTTATTAATPAPPRNPLYQNLMEKGHNIPTASTPGRVYQISGESEWRDNSGTHYRRASFGLLFYDVKNPGVNLQSWIDGFVRNSPPNAELIIVGNKIDLVPCVGLDVQILLRGGVHKTFNISVKTGAGVDALWEYIHKQIVAQYYESLDPDA